MKNKYKLLAKNIGLFTIGSFGSKIITFLLLPLYTSILNTNDYGTVDILQTTAQLLMPILLLSIQDATLRFGMDDEYKKEDVLSTTIKVIIIGTTILAVGLFLIYCFNIFELSLMYILFLFLIFIFSSLNNCFNLYLKSKNQASVIAVSGIVGTLVTCISNVILLVLIKCGINGYMISLIFGMTVQAFYQFVVGKLYHDVHIKQYHDLSKEMIKYSLPLISNSVAWWVNNASDRYIITFVSGIAVNGVYSIAYKIPTILTTFQSIFYNAWSISAIKEFNYDDYDGFIGKNYMTYSFLSMLVCSFLMLLNIPLAKILYSNEFYSAWVYVPFLLTGTVFNGISQLEGALFAATKKTKIVAKTTTLGAIINIIFSFGLIYLCGPVGVAFATLMGYLVTWIFRTLSLNIFIKMKVDWKSHLISVVVLLLQSVLSTINKLLPLQLLCTIVIIILHFKYFEFLKKFILKKK